MDLIRKIILTIEDHPSGWAPELKFEGYTEGQIGYHSYLIVAAGLADGCDATTRGSDGPEYCINHLTPAGHDFAESARNEFVWDKAMSEIKDKGLRTATLDIIKKLLDRQIRKQLELE